MTSVTIQSNKIVLNDVKDNKAPLQPPYRGKMNFLANPTQGFSPPDLPWRHSSHSIMS